MDEARLKHNGTEASQAPCYGYGPQSVKRVPIDAIELGRRQWRQSLGDIDSLVSSIKQIGVQIPIMVLPVGPGSYRIVYGHRRLRAAEQAGLTRIPAIIAEGGELLDEVSLVENLHRATLNVVDYVLAVRAFGARYKQQDIAIMFGMSEAQVSKCVAAANFIDEASSRDFLNYQKIADMAPSVELLYKAALHHKRRDDLAGAVAIVEQGPQKVEDSDQEHFETDLESPNEAHEPDAPSEVEAKPTPQGEALMDNTKHRNVSRRLTKNRATRILRMILALAEACAHAHSLEPDLRDDDREFAALVGEAAQALPTIEGLLVKMANEMTA